MSAVEKVFTIGEVAKLAGWSRLRMWRHLRALDREVGGMLLKNVGRGSTPRWTVTMSGLQSVAPQWFRDSGSIEARVAELEERLDTIERVQGVHTHALMKTA